MLSSFGEKALICRNLADQSRQREAGIPTSCWKLITVPISTDLTVVHKHPPPKEPGFQRAHLSFKTSDGSHMILAEPVKVFQPNCLKYAFELNYPSEGNFCLLYL